MIVCVTKQVGMMTLALAAFQSSLLQQEGWLRDIKKLAEQNEGREEEEQKAG